MIFLSNIVTIFYAFQPKKAGEKTNKQKKCYLYC